MSRMVVRSTFWSRRSFEGFILNTSLETLQEQFRSRIAKYGVRVEPTGSNGTTYRIVYAERDIGWINGDTRKEKVKSGIKAAVFGIRFPSKAYDARLIATDGLREEHKRAVEIYLRNRFGTFDNWFQWDEQNKNGRERYYGRIFDLEMAVRYVLDAIGSSTKGVATARAPAAQSSALPTGDDGASRTCEEVAAAEIALDAITRPHVVSRRPGQGYGLTHAERKIVELHAMQEAKRHLKSLGFSIVEDVSQSKPYDLVVSNEHRAPEIIVEVKGSTGPAVEILLTAGEVAAHGQKSPANGLLIVSKIDLVRTGTPSASGGEIRWICPWEIRDESLRPIAYRYAV